MGQDPDAIRREIEQTRNEMGETMDALGYKADVKSRARENVQEKKDAVKGKALVDFLWWGIHDGENFTKDLQYAPLPPEIVKRAEAKINSITSGGKPLRAAQ